MGKALSVRDVAEHLGIRRHVVLALIHSGDLRAADVSVKPAVRPHWRILPEDLESFLDQRVHGSTSPRRRRRQVTPVKRYF
jgi:excisionase family DNA binding protein